MQLRIAGELDVQISEPERFARVAADWLDRGSAALAGEYRSRIEEGPPLAADSVRRNGPVGTPGSVWGFVNVVRGRRRGSRVYSVRNLAWLHKELADPPDDAELGLSVLDAHGYPDESPLRIRVQRAGDWARLSAQAPEHVLAEPAGQRRWLGFLRSVAETTDPGFGHLDYLYTLGKTAVEETVGPPWRMPEETVPQSRETLRGYAWLTVLAGELADRLGGVSALAASGAFHEVHPLGAGGVWLLATADYHGYDEVAVERVFEALAPVLPPGEPKRWEQTPGQPPHRVAYRDAATVGGR